MSPMSSKISDPHLSTPIATVALGFAIVCLLAIVATQSAQAQTYRVLHTFTGPDGAQPVAALVRDAAGNLYGTTFYGGNGTLCGGTAGCGTVFKLSPNGVETVLYSFSGGADGANPKGLFRDASGILYGVASTGGNLSLCGPYPPTGCGVIFKLSPPATICRSVVCPWRETVLHTFTGPDGALPEGSLIQDAAGNFYGATLSGGADQYGGTVFKIDVAGQESVLLNFYYQGSNGFEPMAGLIESSAGTLYGTTYAGGNGGYGVIYQLDPTTGQETVLHRFSGYDDGGYPLGALLFDGAGNLYGTTWQGGFMSEECYGGCGVVFKQDTSGHLNVLYSFLGGADGGWPFAGLIRDAAGNLYGTTSSGGNLSACYAGCGVVFKLDANGSETVLYAFADGADGYSPGASLIQDAAGNLYGTTTAGGDRNCPVLGGCGVVFEITP